MSVLKNDRNESSVEFIFNMKKIHLAILKFCMKCPKRWDRFITEKICEVATNALVDTKFANSIYPTTQHERELRKDKFIAVLANLQVLITLMDNLYDYCTNNNPNEIAVSSKQISSIMTGIEYEIKLIKGVMLSDTKRYKNLPKDLSEK